VGPYPLPQSHIWGLTGKPMKKYRFSVLIERDEDGFLVATVPALKSCYTQAKTMEELMPRVREVIELCL